MRTTSRLIVPDIDAFEERAAIASKKAVSLVLTPKTSLPELKTSPLPTINGRSSRTVW